MPRTSAYWSRGRAAPPAAGSRSLDDGAGAPASVAEIQAALLQPGGGSIQQRRRVVVDAGPSYRLGRAERDARLARKADASRLERLRQVREQERLWARFQAKEFRASVADHHAELTHQLREGWLAARKAKQEELERDYGAAVAGVGRAQRDAAANQPDRSGKNRADRKADEVDEELCALERFETALGREFARLDALDAPYFAAKERRVNAVRLADATRDAMRAKLAAFDASEEGQRRKLVDELVAETDGRVARPLLRPDAFASTHFNQLVVDSRGVGVRTTRAKGEGANARPRAFDTPAAGATGDPRDVAPVREGGRGHRDPGPNAFESAFEEEKRLATRRDAELRRLKSAKAKEARRANAAAREARIPHTKREMEAKLDEEAKAERRARIARFNTEGEVLVHAPLFKSWREKRREKEGLEAFEHAFRDISEARGSAGSEKAKGKEEERKPPPSKPRDASGKASLPVVSFDDQAPFAGMFDDDREEARLAELEKVLAMAQDAVPVGPGPAAPAGAGVAGRRSVAGAGGAAAGAVSASVVDPAAPRARSTPGAAERLAKMGVVGATMDEIAAVVQAGEAVVPSASRVARFALSEDSESDEDGFVPVGGVPPPALAADPADDAALDAALAATNMPGYPRAAPADDGRFPDGSLDASGAAATHGGSLDLSDDTAHVFSATMEDTTTDLAETDAGGAPASVSAPSATTAGGVTLGGTSSSGSAEAEMRASLAATSLAMDRVTAASAAAEANLDAAQRAAEENGAFGAFSAAAGVPSRVPVPELRPLDAILGALSEQVDALDAAAEAAAAAHSHPPPSSTSTDAAYAAASLAANTSGTELLPGAEDGVSVSEGAFPIPPGTPAADPTDPASLATPTGLGAPATPFDATSSDASPYDLQPQREMDVARGSLSAVAARAARAAVREGVAGEAPETTAKRVASAMLAALDLDESRAEWAASGTPSARADANAKPPPIHHQFQAPSSPALWDGDDRNPDSSWARALDALDDEWAASVVHAEPPRGYGYDSKAAGRPGEARATASAESDDDFAAAEAEAEAQAEAEAAARGGGGPALAAPMRVSASDGGSRASQHSDEPSLSLDGRSLAALAAALDAASFDLSPEPSRVSVDESQSPGGSTRDKRNAEGGGLSAKAKANVLPQTRRAFVGASTRDAPRRVAAPRPRATRTVNGSLLGRPGSAFIGGAAMDARESGRDHPIESRSTPEGASASGSAESTESEAASRARARARRETAAALRKKAAAVDRKNRDALRRASERSSAGKKPRA